MKQSLIQTEREQKESRKIVQTGLPFCFCFIFRFSSSFCFCSYSVWQKYACYCRISVKPIYGTFLFTEIMFVNFTETNYGRGRTLPQPKIMSPKLIVLPTHLCMAFGGKSGKGDTVVKHRWRGSLSRFLLQYLPSTQMDELSARVLYAWIASVLTCCISYSLPTFSSLNQHVRISSPLPHTTGGTAHLHWCRRILTLWHIICIPYTANIS